MLFCLEANSTTKGHLRNNLNNFNNFNNFNNLNNLTLNLHQKWTTTK